MADKPMVCSLPADQGVDRLGEWQAFLGRNVTRVRRISPQVVELVLRDEPEVLTQAVDLGRREQGCCGFLEVTLDLRANEVLLRISAPKEAEVVIDTLIGQPAR